MDDFVGAFCRPLGPNLQGAAVGPLKGLRFAAKDIFDIEGHVTGCGNPDWKRTHEPALATAPAVQACLDGGAELVGKTITDELAFSLNGENVHYGTPVNVNAEGRIPGGSSSGSAAAVAAGLVDFAIGSDTAGSIRLPGSYCGVWGIRPTHGRTCLKGAMPLAPSFDVVGWFARDPKILAKLGRFLLPDPQPALPPTRMLNPRDAWALADPGARAALRPAFERLVAHFGGVTPITVAPEGFDAWMIGFRHLQGREVWSSHGAWIQTVHPTFGPAVGERFAWTATITEGQALAAAKLKAAAQAHLEALLPSGVVLVLPSAPFIAPRRGVPPEQQEDIRARIIKLTTVAGLGGLPQVTLPVGTVSGCPIGISLIAGRGGDEMLLNLAAEIGPDLVRAGHAAA